MRYCYLCFTVLLLGTVSLSGQKKVKKTEAKWKIIPKLIVSPGRRPVQLKSNFLQIDTLIMRTNSRLSLAQGDNILIVGQAIISSGARIIGRGKNGVNGQNGRHGEPAVRMPGARDGSRGFHGTNGEASPNLKLYLGKISYTKPLNIQLTGGNGGNGGNGGDGGTKKTGCRTPGVNGTNGGDAGQGGGGGAAGELFLVLGENISHRAITYKSQPGKPGNHGLGGKPGLIIRNCGILKKKSRPGKHGSWPTNIITYSDPDTNPDFLEFPSPIPRPSAITEVPIKIPEEPTFGMVEAKLRSALNAYGYVDLNYRRYRNGFAIFTGMEHINSEGVPLAKYRFSPEQVKFYDDPSLISFLKSLFTARKGYSRIIVFIVSDDGIEVDGVVARSEAITWLKKGRDELPEEVGNRPFTSKHKLKALIYEFSKRENDSKPVFSEPTIIGIDKHLRQTELWSMLIAE